MAGDEDWLMRPVDAGYCKYESLLDCTLGLEDIARMNDYIDVKIENEKRFKRGNEE